MDRDDSLLPVDKFDGTLMLPAGRVLREEAWPVLPIARYLHASAAESLVDGRTSPRGRCLYGGRAFGDDAGVRSVERYPKPPNPAWTR
jgi:hypothetical protein